ncbi:MAG TPA: hypothetical protein VGG44_09380 [Tepidisphaeraceae bacterium]|jgi:hypothetical protein
MTEPDQNDPAPVSSEMTNANAASPSDEIHPDSLASQNAPFIEAPPMPLSPMPVLNSIRPPSAGLPGLTPKPSSVPPPRLRPAAPPDSPNNIGPGSGAQGVLTEAEISATQEIAEAISNAQRIEPARAVPNPARSTPTSARAPISRPRPGVRMADPLFIRRTTIPILLTLGVILAGAAALLLFGGEDNALPDLFPGWVPIVFCVLAAICAGVALLNMLSVKTAKQ